MTVGFAGCKIFELNGSLEVLCQQLHRRAPVPKCFDDALESNHRRPQRTFPLTGQLPQHYNSGTTTKFHEPRVTVCPERERAIRSERWFSMTHTVLLVDDDPAVLDVIASMLEEIGCNVIRATGLKPWTCCSNMIASQS